MKRIHLVYMCHLATSRDTAHPMSVCDHHTLAFPARHVYLYKHEPQPEPMLYTQPVAMSGVRGWQKLIVLALLAVWGWVVVIVAVMSVVWLVQRIGGALIS